MSPPLPRTTLVRQFDTCRLVPSRFAAREDSVLTGIAEDDAHLADLFQLDNATNERLRGERGLLPGIGIDELVFGVPNASLINAAFTYAHPQGSRFNGPERGAWYCSFEAETALAEVAFHKSVEYQEIGRFDDSVTYETLLADFTSAFHDIRKDPRFARCLDPSSYVASQRLAARLMEKGSVGVIYPSARRRADQSRVLQAGGRRQRPPRRCVSPHLVGRSVAEDQARETCSEARDGATPPPVAPASPTLL